MYEFNLDLKHRSQEQMSTTSASHIKYVSTGFSNILTLCFTKIVAFMKG